VVGVQNHHLVAEEPGGLRPPVGDQGLGRGQLQFELVVQERPDLGLDLLGLLPGAGEAQQPVVRLCRCRGYGEVESAVLVGQGGAVKRSG
jgi:hypothetical protein